MLTVLVLVAQGPSDEGRSVDDALRKAARETLGAETRIDLRDVEKLPDDADAVALARSLDAGALVEIAWRDATRRIATIRLRLGEAPWQSREIGFADADADAEEGRTLGYAIASLIPESTMAPTRPPPPLGSPPVASRLTEERPPLREPHRYIGALEITGVAAHAIGGYGGGAGGAAAIQFYLSPHFAFRAGGGARLGEVRPAQATLQSFVTSAGIAWRNANATRAEPFALGIRADFLVAHESVNHLDPDDPKTVREGTWVPGGDLMAEGSWLFAEGAGVVIAAGAESFFGTSDIFLRDKKVTSLVPLHLLAEIGLRTRF